MLFLDGLQKDEILAPYTTYKIGGPADYFFNARVQVELVSAIIEARKNGVPYFVLGTGANILFGDKGFRGLVIRNQCNKFEFTDTILVAEGGCTIANLIIESCARGLSGLEHFAGIPSTVGGAIWQNLHFLSPDRSRTAFISEIVKGAKLLTESNETIIVDRDFFNFDYDYSILHDQSFVVLEVTFELLPSSKNIIEQQVEENLNWRNQRQPQLESWPSCGSVFKKIESVGAGRLIQKVGLKGYRIGGIQSSEQHANFLVNTGGGTAADVKSLITLIQEKVKTETGYQLETEISFVGEF